jgi:hypothetical protein
MLIYLANGEYRVLLTSTLAVSSLLQQHAKVSILWDLKNKVPVRHTHPN